MYTSFYQRVQKFKVIFLFFRDMHIPGTVYLYQKTRKLDVCAFVYLVLEMIFSEEFVYRDDPAGNGGWGLASM